jgi:putative alpha-1,2-mannosidase
MTVTNHTALYQFSFPKNASNNAALSPLILLDMIDLPQTRSHGQASVDPKTGRITALGKFAPSFGVGNYNSYVCVDFKGATINDTGTFSGRTPSNAAKNVTSESYTNPAGAWVQFHAPQNGQILARAGISLISIDKACQNAQKEIHTFDFKGTLTAAEKAWRQKLSVISIDATGVAKSFQTIFWSGIYRAMISPQDYTGENPLWTSSEPYYDSYYW